MKANKDTKACGKSKGAGLILYLNNRWCNPSHVTVKDTLCCCDLELLAVSMRPDYLPREFTHVIAVCVYFPPRADAYKPNTPRLFLLYLETLIMSLSLHSGCLSSICGLSDPPKQDYWLVVCVTSQMLYYFYYYYCY